MNSLLTIITVAAGLGFLFTLFNMLKKGGKIAAKLPTNFLIFFLVYALLGLTGFFLKNQIAENPIMIGILLMIASLTGGIIMTNRLYKKWEWSQTASFGKKLLYLFGITLTSILAFIIVFLLAEHQGIPQGNFSKDIVWWLSSLIFFILLPLTIQHLHFLWNEIPKITEVKPIFKLDLNQSPPFMESGGRTIKFQFIIPLSYQSKETVTSDMAIPFNKTLGDAFFYKLNDHNFVKHKPKKIIYAENNKKNKLYGWCFYRIEKIWWGFREKKYYFTPTQMVGTSIPNGITIFVEREKNWD